MPAHTPRAAVIEATEAARAVDADLIVTIGGGSTTDAGKAVQMCLANDIRSPEAIDKLRPVKGLDGIVGPPPMNSPTVRQISVPTTLSAGDFSALVGVTDERTKVKELLRHPRIMPSAVVLDPAITLHTPEWLWLSTGIRAVDHCVEGLRCARSWSLPVKSLGPQRRTQVHNRAESASGCAAFNCAVCSAAMREMKCGSLCS
jgi:maleylacetate reductase